MCFIIGNNFDDFLFASLIKEVLAKWGLHLNKFAAEGANSFL